ncbi:MAG: type IV toxin-antitoxin system AbiEi family antitoxin domain-containing protein [Patulibacter minatonensis]
MDALLTPADDQPRTRLELSWRIAELATRQHGVVTRAQLLELKLSVGQIERRVRYGELLEIAQGVYAVGHRALGRLARVNAVLLQVGTRKAAVSHESAARSWGMLPPAREGDVHVSVTDRRTVVVPDKIALHRPRTLVAADIVERYGLPTTTPERTIRDLLAGRTTAEITRILEQTVTVVGRSPDELHAWAPTLGRVSGKAKLLAALDHVVGPTIIRSELETEFRSLCQLTGLELPETNVKMGRWEVDAIWRHLGLIVELDSYRFHGGRWQFHRDRKKALQLSTEGFEVVRLTWPQVKHEKHDTGDRLGRIVARRRECR